MRAELAPVLPCRPQPAKNSRSDRTSRTNFGTIVRALWPDKPALNLAQRIRSTERAANFYINGKRKISARCVKAIVDEMLE